ncbi:vitellogenic carboxypeptidase-like [Anopheles aquasalis]|uniref:vitellogenic carboxypeptidase-like n=1 Tax=Anopheles aquasalis TaxID=42839 RepID=UPI00215AC66D|nr:vitellogenic carboxypeptidase-like [Anopheles aquasalis]
MIRLDSVPICGLLIFLLVFIGSGQCFFLNPYQKFWQQPTVHGSASKPASSEQSDHGLPLFLTPYIEAGNITEGQRAARVQHRRIRGFESYAGFLTVDKRYNSNLYFWFFPAKTNATTAPLLLWLQGGPGASSLFGLFAENGPFSINKELVAVPRNHSWYENHNLLYIDNPVGTGFSFTEQETGYARNQVQIGEELYTAIVQFLQLFPHLQNVPFYITGESYAGKYVPALGYTIHRKNTDPATPPARRINLAGMAIGNGYSDPINQLNYGDYLYQLGLIDANALERFEQDEQTVAECIAKGNYQCAFDVMDELLDGDANVGQSFFRNVSGFELYYNYLHPVATAEEMFQQLNLVAFLNLDETRPALHVGDLPFHDLDTDNKVARYLEEDVFQSVAPWISELLEHGYRILFYNGQLDIICAYPMMVNYLQMLQFNGAHYYRQVPRGILTIDGETAGYFKLAYALTEVLVRDAGHMVPRDQPKWAHRIITSFTHPVHGKHNFESGL